MDSLATFLRKMAKEKSSEGSITEERVEFMVDPTATKIIKNPTKRTAFFLKPSLNPNSLPPKLPKIQSFSSSSKPKLRYLCCSTPLEGWKTWVEKLEETHESVWRKAGIFDAIKGSTYHIDKVRDLIFSLVERWCPETNTFVFPWGEATVTLEDVYVLGGFSPLGISVLSKSSFGKDEEFVENELIKINKTFMEVDSYVSHLRWQEYFKGCGDPKMEHAGFLCLWLSRHVFPSRTHMVITPAVFAMAARISCGAKLAFGPAVLASVYGDLTLLKSKILVRESCHGLKLTSPLHLVQVWACERFPSLGPVPRMINCGETRLARWVSHARKLYHNIDGIGMCLDSSRQTFRWRPYTMSVANWPLPRFYVNAGKWVDAASHEDWKLFSRCLLVGQLFGLNCVEEYNPHRVALQFGFDQDIPESIDRSKASCKLGWLGYKKNLRGLKLHIPPRLHEGDVTRRYFDWWRAGSHSEEEVRVGCKRKKRPRKRSKKISKFDARENQMEKSPPREESSSGNALQVCNHTRMTCVFDMKVASISQEDTSAEEDEVMTDTGGCVRENPIEKLLPSDKFSPRNVFQIGNDIRSNSQEDPSTEEDEVDEVRFSDHSMGECSNNSDHSSSHNEVEENVINILCSKLAETELKTPCEEAAGSDFPAKHQNLANEVGKVRPEAGSKNCEVNVRDQNEEHNVVEHHVNTEVKASGSLLAEDEPTNQADIPVSGQLAVSNDDNPFLALCVQYESRINRLEREIFALLGINCW
ncbi:uncharacterized protein LOC141646881 isoform X1 [Silene latifolia]|uniref:uncharacterized protein LOC141646881 isoform X1 n=2 Tax=Silene latifolia TaxID=37657 RepID=UPI003D773A08